MFIDPEGNTLNLGRVPNGDDMNNNQHVVPHNKQWAVRAAGSKRVTSVHRTQTEAIDAARSIAQHQKVELLIHGRDGTIRERNSYGADPYPPKG